MAEAAPNPIALWPKLRRRASRGYKSGKGKGNQNPYASGGLEKFAVIYAVLQARRDYMAEKVGAPVSMVRFLSRSAQSCTTASISQTCSKVDSCKLEPYFEELAPVVVNFELGSKAKLKKSVRERAVGTIKSGKEIVEHIEARPLKEAQGSDGNTMTMAISTESRCSSERSAREVTSGVEVTLRREISLKDAFAELPLRGERGVRRRRLPTSVREKRWKHAPKTAVALIVTLGAFFAKKVADLGGSVLAAPSFGVVIRIWRKGKHFLPLHSYLSALATRRLRSSPCGTEEERERNGDSEVRDSPCLAIRRNPNFVFPVLSSDSSPPSPSMPSFTPNEPPLCSPAADPSILREISSLSVSPISSARSSVSSPPSSVESSSLRANKLSQFKSKIFKSFPLNRAASRERELAFSVPSSPISEGNREIFTRSEQWDSGTPSSRPENQDARSAEDSVMKKKKFFLKRRSLPRSDDSRSESSDSRSSSPSRLRFAKLRINISHTHDESEATSSANSPHTLRLGKLRSSTSMKDSPRRTENDEGSSTRPCSLGQDKLRVCCPPTERSKIEPPTPRKSGLSAVSAKTKHQDHEAWLAVIVLVSLMFLSIGRVPAVLATSFFFLFFSQLDKFRHSGGVGRDRDAARRALEASRKLRKSPTPVSPRPGRPYSPSNGRQ